MPFFATRGAVLYTERVRLEKDAFKKSEFETDKIQIKNGMHDFLEINFLLLT